jgi:hypothetical protein
MAAATASQRGLSRRTLVLGKPFRYKGREWCLEDLERLSGPQIEWMRGSVAAVALHPRSHLCPPAQHRARELCLEVLRLNQRRASMKRTWALSIDEMGMALLK